MSSRGDNGSVAARVPGGYPFWHINRRAFIGRGRSPRDVASEPQEVPGPAYEGDTKSLTGQDYL